MRSTTITTAAVLKTVLCFIDPIHTPKIAFYDDGQAALLIEKIKSAVGDKDGSESVSLHFGENEQILKKEFNSVCSMIREVFTTVAKFTADE